MSRRKTKITDRLLALLLSIMMVVALFPTNLFPVMAAEDDETEFFSITVTGKDEENVSVIADAKVILSSEADGWDKNLEATTDENGVAKFSVEDVEKALTDGTGKVKYTVIAAGYFTLTDEKDITDADLTQNIDVEMVKGTEDNSFKVSVKDEEGQALAGAQIILSAVEDTWTLDLIGITDADGYAWLDRAAIEDKLPEEGDKTISYTVSLDGYKDVTDEYQIASDESLNGMSIQMQKDIDRWFEIKVSEGENSVSGAKVSLYSKETDMTLNSVAITNNDGVALFKKSEIEKALNDAKRESGTVGYIVEAPEYYTISREKEFSLLDESWQDIETEIKKIDVDNSFKLTIKDGENVIVGAKVALKAGEDTWSLDLIATSDNNGIAWFDKTYIEQLLPPDGSKTIKYTVSYAGYEVVEGKVLLETEDSWNVDPVIMHKIGEEAFKVLVTENDAKIANATVKLTLKDVDEWSLTATTDNNGYAWFKIEDLEGVLNDNSLEDAIIECTVSNTGYWDKTTEIPVSLSELVKETEVQIVKKVEYTLTVNVAGSASVELNGEKKNVVTVTNEVEDGQNVHVVIEPINGYIQELTIADENGNTISEVSVEKRKSYDAILSVEQNLIITVNVIEECTITTDSDAGNVQVVDENGISVGEIVDGAIMVDKGTKVYVDIKPNDNYHISSISITGIENIVIDGSNKAGYKSAEITVNENIEVKVTYVKVYKVTIKYNEDGTVLIDNGDTEGGTVIVNDGNVFVEEGKSITIVADPEINYRVSNFKVGGNRIEDFVEKNYGDGEVYSHTLEPVESVIVEVEFSPNIYNIITSAGENGSIIVENTSVDYEGSCEIKVRPIDGYQIATLYVDNQEYTTVQDDEKYDGGVVFTLDKITADVSISATFEKISTISLNITNLFNDEEAVTKDGLLFVYENIYGNQTATDKSVKFSTDKRGIRITYRVKKGDTYEEITTPTKDKHEKVQSIEFKESIEIIKIELYSKGTSNRFNSWNPVENTSEHGDISSNNPLKIVIDDKVKEPVITSDAKHKNNFYNDDFKVNISIDNEISGIDKIEYFITDSFENSEKDKEQYEYITEGKKQEGVLYTKGYKTETSKSCELLVDVEEDKNNSDYVRVWFKITDLAGNVRYDKSDIYMVNCSAPILNSIKIENEGTPSADKIGSNYNVTRKVTIEIKDRASAFQKYGNIDVLASAITIKKDGEIIDGSSMIKWTPDGDNLTAEITFSESDHYEWSLNYENLAGGTIQNTVTPTGEDVFEFTVDKEPPTATFSYHITDAFDQILSTLTFGLWTNISVTVDANPEDKLSGANEEILYYKYIIDDDPLNMDDPNVQSELIALYDAGEFKSDKIIINSEEKCVIIARVTDKAGNVGYVSSSKVMFEQGHSEIEFSTDRQANNGFYNGDVNVYADVSDTVEGHLVSGIKKISYVLTCNGSTTDEGVLYENTSDENVIYHWYDENKPIFVEASENNSDNVLVVVTAEDFAGNKSIKEYPLKINVDDVKATIKMSGNVNKVVEKHGYIAEGTRTATIEITERASVFDAAAATAGIKILVNGAENPDAYTISEWTSEEIKNSSDVVTFKATITFKGNAKFNWSFNYTNKAGNSLDVSENSAHLTIEGAAPYLFTLDTENPTGYVKVNGKEWDDIFYEVLRVLTFGKFSTEKFDVTAGGADDLSPVTIEYFKTSKTTMMTEEELNATTFKPYEPFSVTSDETFVVYVKITDYAGNTTYRASDGHIIDTKASTINITSPKDIFNASDKVEVTISVDDGESYSGLKYVKYWVYNNDNVTQSEEINFDVTNPTYEELTGKFTKVIEIDKSKNNGDKIKIKVEACDNLDHKSEESKTIAIDTDKPTISVSFDNNTDNNGNGYFKGQRVATVIITDRNFNVTDANKGINVKATDAEGNNVSNAYSISSWTHKDDTHTVVITFAKDANYTWSIEHTDKAGNKNSTPTTSSVSPYKFTVDNAAPTGSVSALSSEGKTRTWDIVAGGFTFGFISNSKITVSGTFDDDTTSGSLKAEYYKVKVSSPSEAIKPLTEAQLKDIKNWTTLNVKSKTANSKTEFTFGDIVVDKDEQFVIYIKLTDLAGNVKYLSTNGLIVDAKAPVGETLAPEISTTQPKPSNGVYKDDVVVDIKVIDPLAGGTYSGLEKITYKVLNMGEVTQSGELFKFGIADPSQSQLKQTWIGKIEVDSAKNNSNDVQVVIEATDRAGNQTFKTINLKIDTTLPTIDIEYNNNTADTSYAGETLFKEDRVATIKVTERNFDGNKVVLEITNTDGTMPVLSGWSVFKNGIGNGDDTVYMATLTYSADGDYKFAIKYADNADNTCTDIDYGQSLAPTEFTIDKTLPTIQVSYDNTSVANGLYYNQDRVATVTVTEHNFDPTKFELTLTATDNGKEIALPTASQWTSNGDVHRFTIPFAQDGHYTIDVALTDKAGNIATDFAEQNFYIDKTNPTLSISGVVDKSANNAGEVGLVITITDTNVGEFEPNIYAIISTDDDYKTEKYNIGSKQNITNGIKYTVTNLPDDGMYRVECIAKDKAGNIYSEVVLYKADGTSYTEPKTEGDVLLTFSVNREGSVYEVNDITEKLIKDTYVQSISDDIAIVEVNADELVSYEVLLNGRVLVENTDYTVVKEGGNGQWYKYTYLVSKSLFTEDGEYELVISSKDKAYNSAFSDVKGRTITFVVDTTAPVVAVSGLESNGRYNATEHTVTIVPTDDGGSISKVIVGYADKSGNIYEELLRLEGEELTKALEEAEGKLSFVIKEGLDKDIKIMCWDSAFDSEGNSNVYETTFTGVSVSTSQIAMLWANDGIRNGVIISVVVVILGIAALVAIRVVRKKKNK